MTLYIYSLYFIWEKDAYGMGLSWLERWNMKNKTKGINSYQFVALVRTLKQ